MHLPASFLYKRRGRRSGKGEALDRIKKQLGRVNRTIDRTLPQLRGRGLMIGAIALVVIVLAAIATTGGKRAEYAAAQEPTQARRVNGIYYPTEKQLASLTIEPVVSQIFRAEHLTEGKIAIDEDRATLVFSPYSGRIVKLLAKPGDTVTAGQALFTVESPDMVQSQNEFINATAALNKANAALELAQIVLRQNQTLYETRAGPLRDMQQATATVTAAQNDARAATTALEVSRNRLRILGMSDDDIKKFAETGAVSPNLSIYAPIAGTVVQRKVGPGQYVNTSSNSAAANDATYVIGDLSTVWLVAYVRESEAPRVKNGQPVQFTVLAYPERVFIGAINYVGTSLDNVTRRLTVRATINNEQGLFRPEMFANVTILTGEGDSSPAVPRDAVINDGNTARVWVARADKGLEMRQIKLGVSTGRNMEVTDGLKVGERIVTKGTLFVDREGTGG
ncbi:MAG: efflux RND transporter periplasmic adaptor subunit [Pseudolabrys sp.]|nr:efflux RND transporter periplasmic adaptor subunit [Pseudolabrys sp.]